MTDEEFRKLFQSFVERQQLDPKTAERLWQKILEIIFPNPKAGPPNGGT